MEARRRRTPAELYPDFDDHVVPEGERVELINGRLVVTPPASEEHGKRHLLAGYVVQAHVRPGLECGVDTLTRTSVDSDFAPDVSAWVRDPRTGKRRSIEFAVEVHSKKSLRIPTEKARELARRGVRRILCVALSQDRVLEWHPRTDAWTPLHPDEMIDEPCFVQPFPVAALVDRRRADRAVFAALLPQMDQRSNADTRLAGSPQRSQAQRSRRKRKL